MRSKSGRETPPAGKDYVIPNQRTLPRHKNQIRDLFQHGYGKLATVVGENHKHVTTNSTGDVVDGRQTKSAETETR